MRVRGIVRKLDGLGRLVIPKEYRKELGIENGDEMEIFLLETGVLIKKKEVKIID